jgi:PAS domain S-box-containing protein
VWAVDRDLRYTLSQGAGLFPIGLKPDQVVGMTLWEFFGTSDPSHTAISKHLRALNGEEIVYDYTHEGISFRTYLSPLLDAQGNSTGVTGLAFNITEQKRVEAAITESFAIFKTVMDSLDALVYVSDMKTHEILFINQYGKEIFGDITGKICWKSIQVNQDGPCPFCTNEKLLDLDGNPAGIIVWEFKNTINEHWYECHDSAIRWTDGRIVRIEIASDITERKKVQEALAESESFNRGLVESLPDYIAVYGMDGKLLYVNPASARTLGYDAETLIGTHVLSFIAEEYHKTVIAKMTVRKEGGEAPPYEIELVTRSGPRRSVIVKATPIKYQNNPAILLLLIDITDRKRAEEALILANKKLNLLSSITRHDITNQLSVLQGYIRILEKKQPDTMQNEYFQKIATAAQRISSMIQFTREYETIGVSTPVWQDVRTVLDTAAKEAPLGNIVLTNDLPAGTEMFADPLIVKVFYNLMDNAVRYGQKITTIRFFVDECDGNHLIVCKDDGEGVVAEEKEKIFERGFGKNTGLGLALSREILLITGITICENGEPGKGARFEMTVPKGAWRNNPDTNKVHGNKP